MFKQNYEQLAEASRKREARRQQKRKPKMKVSGAAVKGLQKIIKSKGK